MKILYMILLVASSTLAYGYTGVLERNESMPGTWELSVAGKPTDTPILEMPTHFKAVERCSVTSSGRVHTANGSFTATLTVYGACDSNLAVAMRDAINALRALFK